MATTFVSNLKPVLIIMHREVRDQFRDWRIVAPIIVLTVIFPSLMNFTSQQALKFVEQYGANLIAERFIPFSLMIVGFFPITVSMVIALESFAGETERRSIEPLLSSPLTDWQLYLGKLLASLIPPVVGSLLGITTFLVGIYRSLGWTADPVFLLQIILLTMIQALVMVSGAVVISTQTTSVRAANLLSSFIVIPMTLIIQGESIVMFWANFSVLWWIILGMAVISSLLVRAGIAHFNREDLLGREIDVINFRHSWKIFWSAFKGDALNLPDWLREVFRHTLRRLAIPVVIMIVLLPAGYYLGSWIAREFVLPMNLLNLDQIKGLNSGGLVSGLRGAGLMSLGGAAYIWFHNLRVAVLATLLGVLSFGVLGVLLLMLPMAMFGFFAQTAAVAGISPLTFLAAFAFPHGLLEIPAMILSGAVILRMGATMVTPSPGQSIGEAWLRALADWARILLVLIVPLFLGAALIESFITPQTMLFFLGK